MSRPPVKGNLVYLRYPTPGDFEEFTVAAKRSVKFHCGSVKPPTTHAELAEYVSRKDIKANENLLV